MQSDEGMAGERGHKAGDISTPAIQRTASLAVPPRSFGRNGAGDGEGQQLLVLLVRKTDKGT